MKVVLGTDGSGQSQFAADFLLRYPLGEETEIDCCSVYSASRIITATSHPFLGPVLADQISQAVDDAKQHAHTAAHDAAAALRAKGGVAEGFVIEGDPAHALMRFAEHEGASFIAVGARGLTGVESLFLGSVARELANDTHADVLVCRKKEFSASHGLNVLFATDHSDFADRVAAKLPSLVKGKFHRLEILSTMDPESRDLIYAIPGARAKGNYAEMEQELERWLREKSEQTAQQLAPLAEQVSVSVPYGSAREKIVEASKEPPRDLIILGAKGRTGISRLLLGSVSHYVLSRAECSVMIVRA